MSVILETSLGDITIDLLIEERPTCSKNFLKLCKVKYYNFCLFHSVQRNLVAQTGDPSGTGKGGESVYGLVYGEQAKYFDMEVSPRIKHKQVGLVSMVNNGSNMHGSQFFITLGENHDYLDNVHTVFGEVAEGMDIVMKINEAYCDAEHRPFQDIRIYHTVIIDDPFDDPRGLEVPDRSPEPTKDQLNSGRIGADEDLDDFEGMTEQEIAKVLEEREAKANAQILTMVGDLPEEDIAPPENVLFVCKLNPVTTDEDLEIIFSRFGEIVSCEVIRDQKTKESLQYAFVEFSNEESCENAYFKMDNVLIDDRRIHVDFSQSVSKIKWKGKGRGVEIKEGLNKDDFASNYKIKDTSRKDSKYDLVFSDDEDKRRDAKKKKKKKHRERRDSSDSSDDNMRMKMKKRKKSRSPVGRYRSRSSSPEAQQHKKADRYRDREDKNADRGDKYRDRDDKNRRKGDNYRDDKYGGKGDHYRDRDDRSREKGDNFRDRDDRSREKGDNYRDRDDRYREKGDNYRDRDDRYREKGDNYRDRGDKHGRKGDKYRDRDDKRDKFRDSDERKGDKYSSRDKYRDRDRSDTRDDYIKSKRDKHRDKSDRHKDKYDKYR